MIILSRASKCRELLFLAHLSPEIEKRQIESHEKEETNGRFEYLGSVIVAEYVFDGNIYIRVNEKTIKVSPKIGAYVIKRKKERILTITDDGCPVINVFYEIAEEWDPINDPTPFIDDEDFDFGLFIANIISNPNRQKVMLGATNI
jgi:hypothetical protein